MVCCFLLHGPRYETVECTQDMHNEHTKWRGFKRKRQELLLRARTILLPFGVRFLFDDLFSSFFFLKFENNKQKKDGLLKPYVHWKKNTLTVDQIVLVFFLKVFFFFFKGWKIQSKGDNKFSVESHLFHTVWTWKWFVHHVFFFSKQENINRFFQHWETVSTTKSFFGKKPQYSQHYDSWWIVC